MATIKLNLQTNSKLDLGCVQIEIFSPDILVVICGGVFEQLARYTMRYQESDLHLAFILLIFLQLLLTQQLSQFYQLLHSSLLLVQV